MTHVTLGAAFTKLNCEAQILDGDLTNLEDKTKQLLNVSSRLSLASEILASDITAISEDRIKTTIEDIAADAISTLQIIDELLKMIRNTKSMTKEHIESFNKLKDSL